jgi:hypothetical protein
LMNGSICCGAQVGNWHTASDALSLRQLSGEVRKRKERAASANSVAFDPERS